MFSGTLVVAAVVAVAFVVRSVISFDIRRQISVRHSQT